MSESDWLTSADPVSMLEFLQSRMSERKLRLFVLLCCRQNTDLFPDTRFHDALRLADQLIDGRLGERERAAAESTALDAWGAHEFDELDDHLLAPAALLAPRYAVADALWAVRNLTFAARFSGEMAFDGIEAELNSEQATFLRDLVGNPFRHSHFDPAWRTSPAVGLAERMYQSREFSAMPILADALEDAGCDDPDVLAHCRGEGPHVRGCWVVDLVSGRG